jgi:copper(I)-binding protein
VKNLTKRAVYIVGVKSPLAANAMIHETSTVEGQSRMRMRERVTVPGGSNVAFEPEGLHVMLTGVTKPLEVGDKVPVTLELDHGGTIDLVALVRPLDAK